eukprot:5560632-Amphidinium_carterae.1
MDDSMLTMSIDVGDQELSLSACEMPITEHVAQDVKMTPPHFETRFALALQSCGVDDEEGRSDCIEECSEAVRENLNNGITEHTTSDGSLARISNPEGVLLAALYAQSASSSSTFQEAVEDTEDEEQRFTDAIASLPSGEDNDVAESELRMMAEEELSDDDSSKRAQHVAQDLAKLLKVAEANVQYAFSVASRGFAAIFSSSFLPSLFSPDRKSTLAKLMTFRNCPGNQPASALPYLSANQQVWRSCLVALSASFLAYFTGYESMGMAKSCTAELTLLVRSFALFEVRMRMPQTMDESQTLRRTEPAICRRLPHSLLLTHQSKASSQHHAESCLPVALCEGPVNTLATRTCRCDDHANEPEDDNLQEGMLESEEDSTDEDTCGDVSEPGEVQDVAAAEEDNTALHDAARIRTEETTGVCACVETPRPGNRSSNCSLDESAVTMNLDISDSELSINASDLSRHTTQEMVCTVQPTSCKEFCKEFCTLHTLPPAVMYPN